MRSQQVRWLAVGLFILLVGGGLGTLSAQTQTGSPPQITFVDFPSEIPADGSEHTGYVGFKDPDGDVIQADFEVVEAVDFQSFSLGLAFKGLKEGVFSFTISTLTPQEVTLRLILIDEAGNRSEPEEFSFVARGTLADLAVSLEQAPSQVFVGDMLEAQAGIVNRGAVDTGPFRLGLYLSPDAEVTPEDLLLGSRDVSNLAPGASTAETLRAAIPEDLFQRPGFRPGEMFLGVIADDTHQVRESNEANNVASTELRVEERPPIPPPVADFIASPTSGVAPLTVQFTSTSQGEITHHVWDFGDGGTSTEQNPQHTYRTPGTYTVSLTVRGPGGQDTATKPNLITVSHPRPVADFAASPTSGPPPLTVQFSDRSQGEITRYAWDFGDGATSAEQNPQHTYRSPGSYTVSLTVFGPGGEDTRRRPDFITVRHPKPVARFTASPSQGPAPLTVRFTNQSENFTSSFWQFGDGTTSTATHPTHTYQRAGDYIVLLTVRGPGGEDTASRRITVSLPPGVLYQDDFSDPGSGWPVEDWRGYEDGEYFIIIEEAGWWGGSTIPGEIFFDAFCVEVEVRAVSRAEGAYGIAFGFKDWDNNYPFAISTTGRYLLARVVDGNWFTMTNWWTKSSAIKKGTETNHLRVLVDGAHNIKAYVNDQLVTTILMEAPYEGGNIGIYAWAFDDNFKANFDNLKVLEPSRCAR